GNFLYNGSSAIRTGLGPFAPASTTTDLHTRRYFVSVKDQFSLPGGLLEIGVASDADRLNRLPQGAQTFVLTPAGPQGNYFEKLMQNSSRWQGHGDLTLTGKQWRGVHTIQTGFNLDRAHLEKTADRHPVEIRRSDSTLVRSSSFSGNAQLSIS